MPHPSPFSLADLPIYPAARYASLADRIGALLHTRNDVLLVQAEAVVALEAVAASLARPGLTALNVVTSPYGDWFGQWLRRGGATVEDLPAEPGRPITVAAVAAALDARPETGLLALVHAESASGILNPLEEVVALARARGIVTVVDAVASIGGHALDVDALGIDIAVIGPQKALAGPAGVSALSVGAKVWALIGRDGAPRDSILSLADLGRWIEAGRGALPGTPSPLEFFALEAALDRVEAESIAGVVARHALAATATRSGLAALGAPLWVPADTASHLVTTAVIPDGIDPAALITASNALSAGITAGIGRGAERLMRLNHTGPRARFETVLAGVVAYGQALRRFGFPSDIAASAEAVALCYAPSIGGAGSHAA